VLNLHAPAPSPVRDWRDGPVSARMILPSYAEDNDGGGYVMTVPSLSDAFDALVHIRTTTATHLFSRP
jgi:erythromycin esterase